MSRLDPLNLMEQMASSDRGRDVDVFLLEMMNGFGGIENYAREYAESIQAAEKGSNAQLQAFSNLTRLYFQLSTQDEPSELVGEAEVRAQLKMLYKELNQQAEEADGSDSTR